MTAKSRSEILITIAILALLLAIQIFFGTRKQGFHEDEFYSYYSSNRTAGLYTPDRAWTDTSGILDELTVRQGEGFRFSLVKQVQSWDVHPPLYYQALHAVCSLVPGVFTKWTGLCLNLAAFFVTLLLLGRIAMRLRLSFPVRCFLLLLYGLNPAVVSMNMFLRMYVWLTVWVLASLLLHLEIWKAATNPDSAVREEKRATVRMWLFFAAVALCDLCGFLTHYYYLIFVFFLVIVTMIDALWQERKRKGQSDGKRRLLLFLFSHAAGFLAAVLYYPSSAAHILRGYRGKEAAEAFFSFSNLAERIGFFSGITLRNLFCGGRLLEGLALALLVAMPLRLMGRKKGADDPKDIDSSAAGTVATASGVEAAGPDAKGSLMTGICVAGYFLVIAKTALMLGDSSIRYLAPVVPLLLLLLCAGIARLTGKWRQKGIIYGYLLFLTVLHLSSEYVLFLYPENAERLAFDRAHRQAAVVVAFNPLTPHNVWRIADHLLQFDAVYFVDEGNTETIADERLEGAQELLIFAADEDNRETILEELQKIAGREETEPLWRRDMWTLFRVGSS